MLAAVSSHALAQEAVFDPNLNREGEFARDRNISVRQRPHPEYATPPNQFGALIVAPAITAVAETSDNIYATDDDEVSDVIGHLIPSLTVRTNWSRHSVLAFARADVMRYADNGNSDATTWVVGSNGRFDVRRGSAVQVGASYGESVEPRTSASTPPEADAPQKYEQARAFIGGTYTFNRLRVFGQGAYEGLRFDDLSIAGVSFSRSYRDRDVFTLQGRGEYALTPSTSLFGQVVMNTREAVGSTPGVTPRDSTGVEGVVGVNFEIGLFRSELALGYLDQNYDAAQFEDVSGGSVHAKLEYFPTNLITLSLTADRSVEDSALLGAAGYLHDTVAARADYELLRNLILSGQVSYGSDDYRGLDRTDKDVTATLSASLLINRSMAAVVGYQYQKQDSSGDDAGRDFNINRFTAGLTYRF